MLTGTTVGEAPPVAWPFGTASPLRWTKITPVTGINGGVVTCRMRIIAFIRHPEPLGDWRGKGCGPPRQRCAHGVKRCRLPPAHSRGGEQRSPIIRLCTTQKFLLFRERNHFGERNDPLYPEVPHSSSWKSSSPGRCGYQPIFPGARCDSGVPVTEPVQPLMQTAERV